MDYPSEAKDLITKLSYVASRIDEAIVAENKALGVVRGQIDYTTEELKQLINERNQAKADLLKEKKDIEKTTQELGKEKRTLTDEVSVLIGKKADLLVENARLTDANKAFLLYEEKAWKVLHAKENGLIERETTLQQREALRPQSKAILPAPDMI